MRLLSAARAAAPLLGMTLPPASGLNPDGRAPIGTAMGEKREPPVGAVVATTTQIAIVGVAGAEYALPMALVRQIAPYRAPRPVPGSPSHVEGVVNLGGRMVAVVSLRSLLGVGAAWTMDDARIVVVAAGPLSAGLVVDEVSEILIVDPARCALREATDTPGPIGGSMRIAHRGMQLLDVPRILGERTPAA